MAEFADEDIDMWSSIGFNAIEFTNLPIQVKGAGVDNKLDVKDAQGSDGGSVTPRGSSPRKFTITMELWQDHHRRALGALLPLIAARPGKTRPQPVIITYPSLSLVGILEAWVDKMSLPEGDERGIFAVTLDCIEFLKPKPAAKKVASPNSFKGSSVIDRTEGFGGPPVGFIDLDRLQPTQFRSGDDAPRKLLTDLDP
jgi:hypothetical protein